MLSTKLRIRYKMKINKLQIRKENSVGPEES